MEFYKVVNKVLSRINEYNKYALDMTAPTINFIDGDEDDSYDRKIMDYRLNFSHQSQHYLTVKADISLSDDCQDYEVIHVVLRLLAGVNGENCVIETRLFEGIHKITDEMLDDKLNEFFAKYEEEITINENGIELKKMKPAEIINYIETAFEPVLAELLKDRLSYSPTLIMTDSEGLYKHTKLFMTGENQSIRFNVENQEDEIIKLVCDYENDTAQPDIKLQQEFLQADGISKIDIDRFLEHCKRSLKGAV